MDADILFYRLESYEPVFRGRKLVLNYTGGSLCPSSSSKRSPHAAVDLSTRAIIDDDDDKDKGKDEDKDSKKKPSKDSERRKTAIISLLCESDPLAKTAFSFVAAVDDCVYFFEGRSPFACGGVHIEEQALGPGGVFGVIMLIAVLVYFVGGCVYQRTVMHQRGWRQLPNYTMWADIARFIAVCSMSNLFLPLTIMMSFVIFVFATSEPSGYENNKHLSLTYTINPHCTISLL